MKKFKIIKNIKTYLLSNKGVSLIITLSIISFMISFIIDLMVSSRVANQMTLNLSDGAKAEYLAKSGNNLASFLLAIDYGIDLKMAEVTKTAPTDGDGDIWAMFNQLPIGSKDSEMIQTLMQTFGLSDIADNSVIQTLKDFGGSFVIENEDESSKINLSYFSSSEMSKSIAIPMLDLFFKCASEKDFLEEKNIEPTEMVYKIHDFIDKNKRVSEMSGLSSEVAPYQSLQKPYKPFNHPLHSINQLRMIHKWDREMHAVYSPFLTVHPVPDDYVLKRAAEIGRTPFLNINTVSKALLQCLFPEMTNTCYESFVKEFSSIKESKGNLATSGDISIISAVLDKSMCYVKNPAKDRAKWFKASSTTFRIKSIGYAGDSKKILETVVHRLSPRKIKSNQVINPSASSLQLLYRKLH